MLMNRLRLQLMKAVLELVFKERESILVIRFMLGLRDRDLANNLAVTSLSS